LNLKLYCDTFRRPCNQLNDRLSIDDSCFGSN
jgi:hypothetical protein